MLSLAVWLLSMLSQVSSVSSGALVNHYGTRTVYRFTTPIVITAKVPTDPCKAYHDLHAKTCVQDPETEDFTCSDEGAVLKAFKACQAFKGELDCSDPYISSERHECHSSACETVGPRLDGTMVTICSGTVVAVALGSDVRVTR